MDIYRCKSPFKIEINGVLVDMKPGDFVPVGDRIKLIEKLERVGKVKKDELEHFEWVCKKSFKMNRNGKSIMTDAGMPVPEVLEWKNPDIWESTGFVEKREIEKPIEKQVVAEAPKLKGLASRLKAKGNK